MSIWASPADVKQYTGITVDPGVVNQAELVISTLTGAIPGDTVNRLSKRDLYYLRGAVAWQAAWMADQPDFTTRSDVASMSQDGQSATLKPDALILAPLAKRCLKRLSWRGTRTIFTAPTNKRLGDRFGQGPDDAYLPWRPL